MSFNREITMESAELLTGGPPGTEGALILTHLSFPSLGAVERSLTVAILQEEAAPLAGLKSGMALIDNDNGKILCHGLTSIGENPPIVALKLACLIEMEWRALARHVRGHASYCKGVSDIDAAPGIPDEGNALRQRASGIPATVIEDIRTPALIEASDRLSPDFSLPAVSRAQAINDIDAHLRYTAPQGRASWIAWDVRMKMQWNRTGRIRGADEVRRDFDRHWNHMICNDDALFDKIASAAIAPWIGVKIPLFEQSQYCLKLKAAGTRGGFVALESFADLPIRNSRDATLTRKLASLDDDAIANLWAALRWLDFQFSIPNRKAAMELACHQERLRCEADLSETLL